MNDRVMKRRSPHVAGQRAIVWAGLSFSLLLVVVVIITGCAGGRSRGVTNVEISAHPSGKLTVEAYLFDVVVKRDGKLTSLRLDLFDADTMIALGGRAYLGKGALKGRITRDSAVVYFPTSDEFIAQDWSSFTLSADSARNLSDLNFAGVFKHPPDTGTFADSISVEATLRSRDELELYICQGGLNSRSAKWGLALKYVMTGEGHRLSRFEYHSRGMEIKGVRREYRARARVSRDRFRVGIPLTATPVTP